MWVSNWFILTANYKIHFIAIISLFGNDLIMLKINGRLKIYMFIDFINLIYIHKLQFNKNTVFFCFLIFLSKSQFTKINGWYNITDWYLFSHIIISLFRDQVIQMRYLSFNIMKSISDTDNYFTKNYQKNIG